MKKRLFSFHKILNLSVFMALYLLIPHALAEADVRGISVSLINLIATPERYDGKLVFVNGYASIGLENMSLCPFKHTASTKDCIWLNIDSGPYATDEDMRRYNTKEKIWEKFNGKIVSIRGTFDKKDTGHLGMWSGAIKDIVEASSKGDHFSFDENPAHRLRSLQWMPPPQPQSIDENAQSIDSSFLLSAADEKATLQRAEAGDRDAAFRLSFHFMSAGDNEQSKHWQLVAAQNGHPVAQYNQWFDLKDKKDCASMKQALAWLTSSAEGGFQDAKSALKAYSHEVQSCTPSS